MTRKPIVLCIALLGATSLPALAQNKPAADTVVMAASAPGQASLAATATVAATVEAIDKATRKVTLKNLQGRLNTVTVGPEVRNFEQIEVGDIVTVRYVEALTLTLKKGGKELTSMTETPAAVRAPAGERPTGAVGQQVEVTADVIATDAKTQTVTLKGPRQTVELKVPDAGQFKLIKVGDQIQAVYVEAVAVAVEPARK